MDPSKELLLFIIKFVTLYNAQQDGWKVQQIDNTTFELTKILHFAENIEVDEKLEKLLPKDNELDNIICSALEITNIIRQKSL